MKMWLKNRIQLNRHANQEFVLISKDKINLLRWFTDLFVVSSMIHVEDFQWILMMHKDAPIFTSLIPQYISARVLVPW